MAGKLNTVAFFMCIGHPYLTTHGRLLKGIAERWITISNMRNIDILDKDAFTVVANSLKPTLIGIKGMVKDTWIPISVSHPDNTKSVGRDIGDKTQGGAVERNIVDRIIVSNEEERGSAKDLPIIVKVPFVIFGDFLDRLRKRPLSPKPLHHPRSHDTAMVRCKAKV
jgi:hypothetical protein